MSEISIEAELLPTLSVAMSAILSSAPRDLLSDDEFAAISRLDDELEEELAKVRAQCTAHHPAEAED